MLFINIARCCELGTWLTLLHRCHSLAPHARVKAPIMAHLDAHTMAQAHDLGWVMLLGLHRLLRRNIVARHGPL